MDNPNQIDQEKPEEQKEGAPEEAKNKTLLKTAGLYAIFGADGKESERNKAKIVVKEEEISFLPDNGKPFNLAIREIAEAAESVYAIKMRLTGGTGLEISRLGYQYEDFWRAFWQARNAILINDLLLKEPTDRGRVNGQASRYGADLGGCVVQFYETSFLVLPRTSEPFKIQYGDVNEMKVVDFKIILADDRGETVLSQLGERFDLSVKTINDGMTKISLETQRQIKEMMPALDSLAVRQLADAMRDGRCVARSLVDGLAPGAWDNIEKFLAVAGIREGYDYLKSQAGAGNEAYVGIKRAMMGSLAGDYVWFLMPLETYNAIAMEATSQEGAGKATYFFRLGPRSDFSAGKKYSLPDLEKIVSAVQQCVKRINFRREPIYLSEEKLKEPKYWKYKFILDKIPELEFLRGIFIGRVFHRSSEQWQKDAQELLKFNVSQKDGVAKWKAADDNLEPEETPDQNEQNKQAVNDEIQ